MKSNQKVAQAVFVLTDPWGKMLLADLSPSRWHAVGTRTTCVRPDSFKWFPIRFCECHVAHAEEYRVFKNNEESPLKATTFCLFRTCLCWSDFASASSVSMVTLFDIKESTLKSNNTTYTVHHFYATNCSV